VPSAVQTADQLSDKPIPAEEPLCLLGSERRQTWIRALLYHRPVGLLVAPDAITKVVVRITARLDDNAAARGVRLLLDVRDAIIAERLPADRLTCVGIAHD
jgi:hypothetical protein